MECDTVDECFFGGHTEHFKEYRFDEEVCDDWHLYAAESCLKTKSKDVNGRVFACEVELIHLSSGNYSPLLYTGFYRLCRKYASEYPVIKTCCLCSRTDSLHLTYYCMKYYVRAILRKILKRMGLYERIKKFLN